MCNKDLKGLPKLTLPPWGIDKELKNILIILTNNLLIEQSYDKNGNKVRYSLTELGNEKTNEILSIPELLLVADKAKSLASSVNTTVFKKSKVIF
ncbi:hypothetical protein NXY55_04385 [Aeromonas veronii]|nr:hypothetical protein [Aeromonas veronii]